MPDNSEKNSNMSTNLKHKLIIFFALFVALVFVAIKTYKSNEEAKIKAAQDKAWQEIRDEYDVYCKELPDRLRSSMSLGDNVEVLVEKKEFSHNLKNGERLFFFYDVITIKISGATNFSNISDRGKYEYMHAVIEAARKTANTARNDYYYMSMLQNEREKLSNHLMSFNTRVHVEVYDGAGYSMWNNVDALYSGNNKIYDPAEETAGDDGSRKSNASLGFSSSSGTMTFNEMMTDPDDYDDPDDFAEDAWGVDFEDYDEAYDFWENW